MGGDSCSRTPEPLCNLFDITSVGGATEDDVPTSAGGFKFAVTPVVIGFDVLPSNIDRLMSKNRKHYTHSL